MASRRRAGAQAYYPLDLARAVERRDTALGVQRNALYNPASWSVYDHHPGFLVPKDPAEPLREIEVRASARRGELQPAQLFIFKSVRLGAERIESIEETLCFCCSEKPRPDCELCAPMSCYAILQ